MRYAFVAAHVVQFSLSLMCRTLRVSRSGYYAWRKRPASGRSIRNHLLLERIQAIHKKSRKTYGSPRIHRQLVIEGERCGRGRVERLMSANGIRAKHKRRFVATTDSKHNLPIAENILKREFRVEAPNRVWSSDITYIPTDEGWLYLAGVLDLCSRTAVGWSMSDSLEKGLVLDALKMAHRRRQPGVGLVHHSDRGSQYASDEYRELLDDYGMKMSMSRKGDCWDNAVIESFFGTLKRELVHHRSYRTRAEARKDIFEYIEVFYNRERLHSSLGYMSPLNYEQQIAVQQAA
jgi:transposase InsO family protein